MEEKEVNEIEKLDEKLIAIFARVLDESEISNLEELDEEKREEMREKLTEKVRRELSEEEKNLYRRGLELMKITDDVIIPTYEEVFGVDLKSLNPAFGFSAQNLSARALRKSLKIEERLENLIPRNPGGIEEKVNNIVSERVNEKWSDFGLIVGGLTGGFLLLSAGMMVGNGLCSLAGIVLVSATITHTFSR
ncbi:hypothetical protein AKJ41_05405 [candidate division MSBL1 archaeon SCGC-AAA259O05]|uniref:Uncharacterized protein n=1 Tax=candidate division MSBL1 archaeon SCGC-AAA259O05 TaxID=1698271 RepID=A0A133UZ47_9EURY|nr:hypothetical protein AKJ41_05405 [candidate division MSBL1 archaeon SCGC-AAA259O05]